jgi:transposase
MVKYTLELKLEAVNEYIQGKGSYRSIGKKLGINHRFVHKWVAQYEAQGVEGLISRYTNYSPEFKMDVIKYMNETGSSLLETAAKFNISAQSTILQWRNILEEEGVDALIKKRGRPSMNKETKKPINDSQEDLVAENERLRMEVAYLKKLHALIQEKEKLQKKKKRK